MKCPHCQAKLLPVDGELFCLQCGQIVKAPPGGAGKDEVKLADATDPVLRRAIGDATNNRIQFADKLAVDGITAAAASPAPVPAVVAEPVPGPAGADRAIVMMAEFPTAPSLRGLLGWLKRPGIWQPWVFGVVIMTAFIGVNLVIKEHYAQRIYPGVRVAGVEVGGWTYDELYTRLPQVLAKPKLTAVVGNRHIELPVAGTLDSAALEQEIYRRSDQMLIPIAAWAGMWLRPPLNPAYKLNEKAVEAAVEGLAAEIDTLPSDAAVMVVGTNPLVIADKPGVRLDQVEAVKQVKSAYGRETSLTFKPVALEAKVKAADYAADVAAAQQMIGQRVDISLRGVHYAPTAENIASWLVFAGPGKGVVADPAGAASFVAAIGGEFDRAATVAALTGALNARQAASLTAATAPVTAQPTPASAAPAPPAASYQYCIDTRDAPPAGFISAVAQALGSNQYWGLGGRVKFVFSPNSCNFRLYLAAKPSLGQFDPACTKQSSCRIHNDLVISALDWDKTPDKFSGNAASYHLELINHVVGQWLGFEHNGCISTGAAAVLSAPTVVIPGCSPNWYAVPAEVQDTKVLPGL